MRSSQTDEAAAGWRGTPEPPLGSWEALLGRRRRPKWDTFSWVTVRALLDSANDTIAKAAPSIVRDRRRRYVAAQRGAGAETPEHGPPPGCHGTFGPDFVLDWTGLENPRFMLVGDPGEADASQYATVAPLLHVHSGGAGKPSDFLVVLSDVIYPAGDVNDYVNGFYIPFAGYDRPIYALPGNHDWYDGLDGFMYHFCRAEPLPPQRFSGRGRSFSERVLRALWRKASRPDRDLLAPYLAHRDRWLPEGSAPRPVQPAPYFAIELEHLMLVAVDPGVSGELDAEQGAWLQRVSAGPKPKVLLTGKPIWVDNEHVPGDIAVDERRRTPSVDEIVTKAEHNYVAAIGGDTHNYQRYSVRVGEKRRIAYIVAGGGGAYLSETHTIPAGSEGRFGEEDFCCYPTRADSLALFCRRVGPVLVKALATVLLVTLLAGGIAYLVPLEDARRLAAAVAAGAVGVSLGALALLAAKRASLAAATLALVVAGFVAGLLAIGNSDATLAVAVAAAVPPALVIGLVSSYALRGSLPERAPDWLLAVPLLALPSALWAPYALDGAGLALAYGAAPIVALAVVIALSGLLRTPAESGLGTPIHQALVALAWLGVAVVVTDRFGERWMLEALAALVVAIALIGVGVPRIGPGRRRGAPRDDYALGSGTTALVGAAVTALALCALEALGGEDAALVAVAGIGADACLAAALGAFYLLLVQRLIDPRVLWHMRTGRISPAGAARYLASLPGGHKLRMRPGVPDPGDAAKERMAAVVQRIGGRVSSIADTNAPPFFKSFLSAEVKDTKLTLRCWGVTGYADDERDPTLEDEVAIELAPRPPARAGNDVQSQGTLLQVMSHLFGSFLNVLLAPPAPPVQAVRENKDFGVGGERCAAWFYPARTPGPAPCVILAHGFDGVREQALDRYAERFNARGLAVFVFDYRHFGASTGQPRQLMSNRRQLQDWRAAIRYAGGLPGVDANKLALWGTSNSGGHVLKVAANDRTIQAVVVQSPFISGVAQFLALPLTHSLRLLLHGAYDQARALLRLSPHTIKAVGRPYTRAVTTTPDALSGLDAITPLKSTWKNEVLARFALTTTIYSATRAGRRLRCPLLVCIGDGDNVIPLEPALKLGKRDGNTLRRYDATHFGLYYGRGFERAVRDQADFLEAQLGAKP